MSFEIKIYDGLFFDNSDEVALDFTATLYEEVIPSELEVEDLSREPLANANGFITQGSAEEVFWLADIDAETFVEGYILFLNYLNNQEEYEVLDESFRAMIIKNLAAKIIGKGSGTKLLSHLKQYALTTGLDHITLIADSKSEIDLDKYYEKVGFLKLPFNNWLYIVDEDERMHTLKNFDQFSEYCEIEKDIYD